MFPLLWYGCKAYLGIYDKRVVNLVVRLNKNIGRDDGEDSVVSPVYTPIHPALMNVSALKTQAHPLSFLRV